MTNSEPELHAEGDTDYPIGLRQVSGRNRRLRSLLKGPDMVIAPGVYDCISARLVDDAGFRALYVTGSGVSMSALGAPDVGLMSFGEILDRIKRIADTVSIPVVADADTGYGGPLNVVRTIRELERAGVSAVQIEDQTWPKKCGHELGRRIVTRTEMVGRLKAAVDARSDDDFVIVARTDARTDAGLDEAIDRALCYAEAGADVLFVESPENEEEMARIAATVPVPVIANMVEGGRTPLLPAIRLQELGFRMAIFPNSLTRAFAHFGQRLLAELACTGTTIGLSDVMMSHRELWSLFEYEKWLTTEKRLSAATPRDAP